MCDPVYGCVDVCPAGRQQRDFCIYGKSSEYENWNILRYILLENIAFTFGRFVIAEALHLYIKDVINMSAYSKFGKRLDQYFI